MILLDYYVEKIYSKLLSLGYAGHKVNKLYRDVLKVMLILLLALWYCWHQTSDALLELAVLGGVDERVDAAAGEHQDHGEVIEPTEEYDKVFPK